MYIVFYCYNLQFTSDCRELRIIENTLTEVVIQKDREQVVFKANENGLYVNGDSQITVTDEGIYTRCIQST